MQAADIDEFITTRNEEAEEERNRAEPTDLAEQQFAQDGATTRCNSAGV